MLVSAILVLALAKGIRAQTSTASLFPLVQDNGLVGQVIGTGADGTTYRLVGTFDASSLAIPFTATLVQDATHMSEEYVLETGGVSLVVQAGCALSSGQASCVQSIVEPSSTSALTLTGPASLEPIPIVSGTALLSSPSHSQITISATGSGTGSATATATGISTLPASISSTATLTGTGASATGIPLPSASTSAGSVTFVKVGMQSVIVVAVLSSLVLSALGY